MTAQIINFPHPYAKRGDPFLNANLMNRLDNAKSTNEALMAICERLYGERPCDSEPKDCA